MEYFRDITVEDVKFVYSIVGIYSAVMVLLNMAFIIWGFAALDQIEDYIDNHDDFNQCGNEFTIAGSTHTANYEYDTTYLLLALFLQVLPFFLTFVLVCVKFGTDYIRGAPWRCLDQTLGVTFATVLSLSTIASVVIVTQVLVQYLLTTTSCIHENNGLFPMAASFIVAALIVLYIELFITIGGLIGLTTTFCCWRYCCCAYTPVPNPPSYRESERQNLLLYT